MNEDILRQKLASACHILAKEGHSYGVLGHLSARISPDRFLMKPRDLDSKKSRLKIC